MKKRLSTAWVQHKHSDDKQKFADLVFNSTAILTRLDEILNEHASALAASEASSEPYDNPNWAYLQAHRNGQKDMIRQLKKLTAHLT